MCICNIFNTKYHICSRFFIGVSLKNDEYYKYEYDPNNKDYFYMTKEELEIYNKQLPKWAQLGYFEIYNKNFGEKIEKIENDARNYGYSKIEYTNFYMNIFENFKNNNIDKEITSDHMKNFISCCNVSYPIDNKIIKDYDEDDFITYIHNKKNIVNSCSNYTILKEKNIKNEFTKDIDKKIIENLKNDFKDFKKYKYYSNSCRPLF